MRDVEKATPSAVKGGGSAPSDNGVPVLSSDEKKNLQRIVQKHEKRISELEQEIKRFESKMTDPAFFNKPGSDTDMKKYGDLKSELDVVFNEWERALEQLG